MLHRRTFLAASIGAFAAPFCAAAQSDALVDGQSGAFIRTLGGEVITLLADKNLTKAALRTEFRRLLKQGFALNGIARFVLGRYWRTANDAQRTRYLRLFEEFIVLTYSARLGQYAGETFKVLDERDDGGRGRLVASLIVRDDGAPVKVQWRVREGRSELKIVDVVIEGISMAITQRSEFAAVIRRKGGTIDGLLDEIENKVNELQ